MKRREFTWLAGTISLETALGIGRMGRLEAAPSKADFTLRIAPVSVELAAGQTIRTVAYNGTVPGPVLRMKEGQAHQCRRVQRHRCSRTGALARATYNSRGGRSGRTR